MNWSSFLYWMLLLSIQFGLVVTYQRSTNICTNKRSLMSYLLGKNPKSDLNRLCLAITLVEGIVLSIKTLFGVKI
jgi:hypothetical protein